MNIGHDLMRRFGPRSSRDASPRPPSMRDRVFAIVVAFAGTAGLFALGWAGRGSEPVARVAVGAAAVLLGLAVVTSFVDWMRRPISETASFDAGDVFTRIATPHPVRSAMSLASTWTGSPMRATLAVLAVVSLLVAFGLARHWGWIPSDGSGRGPRGALAPAVPAPAPPASRP
jgi:hypothetical protein